MEGFYSELIPPEVTRNGPLCMSQHVNLLSCCRVPCSEVDIRIRSPIEKSRHIIVAHNSHVSFAKYIVYLFSLFSFSYVYNMA